MIVHSTGIMQCYCLCSAADSLHELLVHAGLALSVTSTICWVFSCKHTAHNSTVELIADMGGMQERDAALPAILRALTAACQNDYNCKAVAKQGSAHQIALLLTGSSQEAAFEALCLLYTLTTDAEARLAVASALVKESQPNGALPMELLFAMVAKGDAGSCSSCGFFCLMT